VVRGEYHGEGFECCSVLEGFDLAEPTETAPGELAELERGDVLGVEQRSALFGRLPRQEIEPLVDHRCHRHISSHTRTRRAGATFLGQAGASARV